MKYRKIVPMTALFVAAALPFTANTAKAQEPVTQADYLVCKAKANNIAEQVRKALNDPNTPGKEKRKNQDIVLIVSDKNMVEGMCTNNPRGFIDTLEASTAPTGPR